MAKLIPTASQTVGPFFNFGLTNNAALGCLAQHGAAGERIRLSLRIVDGAGDPAPGDAMVELWQADANGHYDQQDSAFHGFGRLETQPDGSCVFETVKPGSCGEGCAPHINVVIFARGLLKHLYTRVYFAGDPANDADAVLALVPEARRGTLMASEAVPGLWHLDIRLQGEGETVFFDL